MTVSIHRIGWMPMFEQMRRPTGFLSRFFRLRVYQSEKIQIDIKRYGEEVAVVVKKCTGPNMNDFDDFTNKEFEPPAYDEAFSAEVCDLLKRAPGVDPYTAEGVAFFSQLVAKMATGFVLVIDKIARAVELQASQVMQTGQLSLLDENGDVAFEFDFKPKATHFPQVATPWSNSADCTPLDDLEAACDVVRADGKVKPNMVILGDAAMRNFLNSDQVKSQADIRRYELIDIDPRFDESSGAARFGSVWVGSYEVELWTYKETYDDPTTSVTTSYIQPDSAIVISSQTRFDLCSTRVPVPLSRNPALAPLTPGRLVSRAGGVDITPNVYASINGKEVVGEAEARPLAVPTQIDGYACVDTGAP